MPARSEIEEVSSLADTRPGPANGQDAGDYLAARALARPWRGWAERRLAESLRPCAHENMWRTKLSAEDLRLRIMIKLTVAPRHLFRSLWAPQTPALQRDAARRDLVELITEGWDTLEIEATTTHETMGHSVPPAAPD